MIFFYYIYFFFFFQGLTLSHDPATSDDSGRASERLTGSSVVSVAPRERDADSSRDRLSDVSIFISINFHQIKSLSLSSRAPTPFLIRQH